MCRRDLVISGFCHERDENCAAGYSEMSIRDCHYLLHNNPEEHSSQQSVLS